MSLASPSADAMNPVVPNMPAPTMFETTSAVALTSPSCLNNPVTLVGLDSESGKSYFTAVLTQHRGDLIFIVRDNDRTIAECRLDMDAAGGFELARVVAVNVIGIFQDVACEDGDHIRV